MDNFKTYASTFKKRFEHKTDEEIKKELEDYTDTTIFTEIKRIIETTRDDLIEVNRPIFIAQGKKDDVIDIKSAEIIYDEVDSEDKTIHYYENSGHVLTIDTDKKEFFNDYLEYLSRFI